MSETVDAYCEACGSESSFPGTDWHPQYCSSCPDAESINCPDCGSVEMHAHPQPADPEIICADLPHRTEFGPLGGIDAAEVRLSLYSAPGTELSGWGALTHLTDMHTHGLDRFYIAATHPSEHLMGYCMFSICPRSKVANVGITRVGGEYRRNGLGTELFEQKMAAMREYGADWAYAMCVSKAGANILSKHGFEYLHDFSMEAVDDFWFSSVVTHYPEDELSVGIGTA